MSQDKNKKTTINLIIFVVALFILAGAYRILIGDGGELKVKDALFIKINPNSMPKEPEKESGEKEDKNRTVIGQSKVQLLNKPVINWRVRSSWITGKTLKEFCEEQRRSREKTRPEINTELIDTEVAESPIYKPHRIMRYQYTCYFRDYPRSR